LAASVCRPTAQLSRPGRRGACTRKLNPILVKPATFADSAHACCISTRPRSADRTQLGYTLHPSFCCGFRLRLQSDCTARVSLQWPTGRPSLLPLRSREGLPWPGAYQSGHATQQELQVRTFIYAFERASRVLIDEASGAVRSPASTGSDARHSPSMRHVHLLVYVRACRQKKELSSAAACEGN
jgi:hypothetical protein